MDDCHKFIGQFRSTWYFPIAAKCRFVQGSFFQKLPSRRPTNCFQEKLVAASKVRGAPIFRARILASKPWIKWLEPDFEQSWIISGQKFLPQVPAGDWVLRQELVSFEGQAWNTCPSKFGASIPNLWACSSSAPVYSCANQPTKVMQCISPENKRNWWIPLNYKPKKSY